MFALVILGIGSLTVGDQASNRARSEPAPPSLIRTSARIDSGAASLPEDELRHHRAHAVMHGAFGNDRFGVWAERLARFFGTPKYILSQTFVVLLWILYNAYVAIHYLSTKAFDPYPFHPAESGRQ